MFKSIWENENVEDKLKLIYRRGEYNKIIGPSKYI